MKRPSQEKPFDATIKPHRDSYYRLQQSMKLEKQGYIDNAIELYEGIINNKRLALNSGAVPYNRLSIIYRSRKEYDKEILVINKRIESLKQTYSSNPTLLNRELEKQFKRLKKSEYLKSKHS